MMLQLKGEDGEPLYVCSHDIRALSASYALFDMRVRDLYVADLPHSLLVLDESYNVEKILDALQARGLV